ncbi:PAQR family membrane homeostasis protein TrhA [Aquimarina celericrescens]|uniref:Hemolysin III family protein n=1 Tax=Aquimarina celericrescens TaxID=1964542 RepID=A0ABW5B0P1_9FLAO|nr:hemolysin III family protein [Aquimarina celericrescens]
MKIQTPVEERWNWLTHGLGFILSFIGLFFLFANDSQLTRYSTFVIVLYSLSLMVLYFASTAYHYTSDEKLKRRFRIMDHISIYFLIAGTYSPVTLITLLEGKGWLLFILVWSTAGIGTILKLFFTGRFEAISLILYLVMGWLIVLDMTNLMNKVGQEGITFMILGGAAYTIGIIFYAMRRLKFHHVIWHLFVMAGSIFHYIFILKFVI